jgi:hypothetical protein
VNGDGCADVVVGAYGHNSNTGRATVYLGNGGRGRRVLVRQRRADGSGAPVQPWGLSHSPDSFQVRLYIAAPLGRSKAKVQVQACPPGVPFGHASCIEHTSATWLTVPTRSVVQTIDGLNGDTLYRWRVRAVYDSPLYTCTPWRHYAGQALEADLRTDPSEVYLPLVLRNAP